MAVRRLLVVMLILLGLSTLAAALVPTRPNDDEETSGTAGVESTKTAPTDTVPVGKSLKLSIEVGGDSILVVPMQVGDQLKLVVSSRKRDQLEIPALGLVETVGPDLPARFEIFAREPGDLGIRYTEADRVVARIEVAPRAKVEPEEPAKN